MGRSVVITTPIPTTDEMAKQLGVGKTRLALIKRIARQVGEMPETSTDANLPVSDIGKLVNAGREVRTGRIAKTGDPMMKPKAAVKYRATRRHASVDTTEREQAAS